MNQKFSYQWYISQFNKAKDEAEKLILSADERLFSQPPEEGRWSAAECFSHLINYGDLYYDNMAASIKSSQETTDNLQQSFQPRWLIRKLASFFEPPYKMKLKTVKAMRPDPVTGFNRLEILDEYVNLQEGFVSQLKKGQERRLDLSAIKIKHPLISFIKMSLTECFALAEAHQRRHQWQAEQTLKVLNTRREHSDN